MANLKVKGLKKTRKRLARIHHEWLSSEHPSHDGDHEFLWDLIHQIDAKLEKKRRKTWAVKITDASIAALDDSSFCDWNFVLNVLQNRGEEYYLIHRGDQAKSYGLIKTIFDDRYTFVTGEVETAFAEVVKKKH